LRFFESGNLEDFIKVVESEALTLHAMMILRCPIYILMKPNTLQIINAIWKFRNDTKIPVCFTLDAEQMSMFVSKTLALSFTIY
jgi:diphosphomevalonate decarboxylase